MKILGVDISIHWSWWAFVFVLMASDIVSFNLPGIIWNIYVAVIILGMVVGHELSHAMMARQYGYHTKKIVMHFLGGIAMIDVKKMKPDEEFWISAAGPFFNIVLATLTFGLVLLNPGQIFTTIGETDMVQTLLGKCVIYFGALNVVMGCFNLLPVYPMDGGRILRSLMCKLKPSVSLNISNGLTLFFAGVFMVLGVWSISPFLVILGGILIFLVWAERKQLTLSK